MRILLVSNLYPPYAVGGYERMAAWVAEGLRARGHSVRVLTGRGPAFAGQPDTHPLLDLDVSALCEAHFGDGIAFADGFLGGVRRHVFSGRNYRAARRLIDEMRPDVVSFWNPAFITFSPLLAARRRGVPAVVHLSDTAVNPFRNPHPPAFARLLRPAARVAVDGLLRFASVRRLIVPSVFLRHRFVERERLPASRVAVLPWPLPPAVARRPAPERREPRASRLLFVGSLAPEKGTRVLVDAFRAASAQRPDLTLTLVGDAGREDVRRLHEAAAGLAVTFRGRLEHEAVLEEYARHDVFVFPSVWDEPFAIVPLEASAMGLAVIATAAGGTPEAVTDGKTGLLVPPGDPQALTRAILALASDPGLGRAIGQAARDHVLEAHDFASFVSRLEAIYEECRSPDGRRS
jgi:glycosyltransferase involved in cell wall biosynthesis